MTRGASGDRGTPRPDIQGLHLIVEPELAVGPAARAAEPGYPSTRNRLLAARAAEAAGSWFLPSSGREVAQGSSAGRPYLRWAGSERGPDTVAVLVPVDNTVAGLEGQQSGRLATDRPEAGTQLEDNAARTPGSSPLRDQATSSANQACNEDQPRGGDGDERRGWRGM
jgi:hypothetical protein